MTNDASERAAMMSSVKLALLAQQVRSQLDGGDLLLLVGEELRVVRPLLDQEPPDIVQQPWQALHQDGYEKFEGRVRPSGAGDAGGAGSVGGVGGVGILLPHPSVSTA